MILIAYQEVEISMDTFLKATKELQKLAYPECQHTMGGHFHRRYWSLQLNITT